MSVVSTRSNVILTRLSMICTLMREVCVSNQYSAPHCYRAILRVDPTRMRVDSTLMRVQNL
jgi:hypothetical protein